ncbi:unnamed protein product [Pedinophyceae sp. YPF-701]|nr:unnamed protein product [Pedinophyceae sp. YPF-701]
MPPMPCSPVLWRAAALAARRAPAPRAPSAALRPFRPAASPRALRTAATPSPSAPTVVVLFGWLGSRARHVRKYEEAWAEAAGPDCRVLAIRPPFVGTIFPALGDAYARASLERIRGAVEPAGRGGARVVLAAMSSGGFLTAGRCLALSAAQGGWMGAAVRAVVLDSCPAVLTPEMCARGVLAGALAARWEDAASSSVLRWLASALESLFARYLQRTSVAQRAREVDRAWVEHVGVDVPRTVLASHADDVVPVRGIQAYVEQEWRARGIAVAWRLWPDAPHVEILKSDRDGYVDALRAALRAAPGGNDDRGTRSRAAG